MNGRQVLHQSIDGEQSRIPAGLVHFIAAAVAVAKERGGAAFEMIDAERLPLGRVLELHRQLRVFVFDEVFARVAAVHADEPVKEKFQVARRPVPTWMP